MRAKKERSTPPSDPLPLKGTKKKKKKSESYDIADWGLCGIQAGRGGVNKIASFVGGTRSLVKDCCPTGCKKKRATVKRGEPGPAGVKRARVSPRVKDKNVGNKDRSTPIKSRTSAREKAKARNTYMRKKKSAAAR